MRGRVGGLTPGLLAVLAAVTPARSPAQVTSTFVQLDFTNTANVTAAMQAAIRTCIAGKFAAVPNLAVGTGAPPANTVALTVNFTDDGEPDLRGVSRKKDKSCDVFVTTYTNATPPPSFSPATAAGRMNLVNALCETGAHEVGHLLCARHNQNAPLGRKYTQDNGFMRTSNGLAVSTMTMGPLVTNAEKAADGTAFTAANLATIQLANQRLIDGRADWNLLAPFECTDHVALIGGQLLGSLEIDGQLVSEVVREDQVIEVVATASGNPGFVFGWLNLDAEHYDALAADGGSDVFLFEGGDQVIFAVAGAPATPFDGQLFRYDTHGSVTATSDIVAASASARPPVAEDYFQTLQLEFDLSSIGQPPVTVELSTFTTSGTDGMLPGTCVPSSVPVPATPPWAGAALAALLLAAAGAHLARRRPTGGYPTANP